jgi:hypothetical protein
MSKEDTLASTIQFGERTTEAQCARNGQLLTIEEVAAARKKVIVFRSNL